MPDDANSEYWDALRLTDEEVTPAQGPGDGSGPGAQKAKGGITISAQMKSLREGSAAIPLHLVEDSLFAGFRQEWGSGTTPDGLSFEINCGAGLGSPWMTVKIGKQEVAIRAEDIVEGCR